MKKFWPWIFALVALPAIAVQTITIPTVEYREDGTLKGHANNVTITLTPDNVTPPVEPPPPPPPTSGLEYVNITEVNGASYQFAGPGLRREWDSQVGGSDYYDAAGVKNGTTPFASVVIDDTNKVFNIPVTSLVQSILAQPVGSSGFAIKGRLPSAAPWGASPPKFASLPSADAATLTVVTSANTYVLTVKADGYTTQTSNSSRFTETSWTVGGPEPHPTSPLTAPAGFGTGILIFDFPAAGIVGTVQSATLAIKSVAYYNRHELRFYRLAIPELYVNPAQTHPELIEQGIAAAGEAGLKTHPDVYKYFNATTLPLAQASCDEGWVDQARSTAGGVWSKYAIPYITIRNEPSNTTAINCRFNLFSYRSQTPQPYQVTDLKDAPKVMHLRYLIQQPASICSNDYLGSKMPAPSGTLVNYAFQSWTAGELIQLARQWGLSIDIIEPCVEGKVGIVAYAYPAGSSHHLGGPDTGDNFYTKGAIQAGRSQPYAIEIRVKMNDITLDAGSTLIGTPVANGEIQIWLDGVKIMDKRDVPWRADVRANVLSNILLDMHGGIGAPTGTNYIPFGGAVAAKVLIGPPVTLQ